MQMFQCLHPHETVTPFDVEDEAERHEPLAKRQKLSTRRVGDEEFLPCAHWTLWAYRQTNGWWIFAPLAWRRKWNFWIGRRRRQSGMWERKFHTSGVSVDGCSGKLDIPLSAKMVRAWRKNAKTETDENGIATSRIMWMRRSQLVGRDFNFLEYREDVYSPASSSSVVKLLLCMAVSNACVLDECGRLR